MIKSMRISLHGKRAEPRPVRAESGGLIQPCLKRDHLTSPPV